jgi:hypothetical protein
MRGERVLNLVPVGSVKSNANHKVADSEGLLVTRLLDILHLYQALAISADRGNQVAQGESNVKTPDYGTFFCDMISRWLQGKIVLI